MTMRNKSTKFTKPFVQAAVWLGLIVGLTTGAYAQNAVIDINDLTEGVPTITATGTSVNILPDSQPDFVHFTFQSDACLQTATGLYSFDLIEADGTLSDRILLRLTQGTPLIDAMFDSRDTILIPKGNFDQGSSPETGAQQLVFTCGSAVG